VSEFLRPLNIKRNGGFEAPEARARSERAAEILPGMVEGRPESRFWIPEGSPSFKEEQNVMVDFVRCRNSIFERIRATSIEFLVIPIMESFKFARPQNAAIACLVCGLGRLHRLRRAFIPLMDA
jgi:hypothetical protein